MNIFCEQGSDDLYYIFISRNSDKWWPQSGDNKDLMTSAKDSFPGIQIPGILQKTFFTT